MESRLIQLDGDCLKIHRKTRSVPGEDGRTLTFQVEERAEVQAGAAHYLGVVSQVDLPGDVVYCTDPL